MHFRPYPGAINSNGEFVIKRRHNLSAVVPDSNKVAPAVHLHSISYSVMLMIYYRYLLFCLTLVY